MSNFKRLYQEAFDVATTRTRVLSKAACCGGMASALITKKGSIFTGICIDCACGIGFCAEHGAISEMLKNGESEISEIIAVNDEGIVYSPCGRCRELIYQINGRNKNTLVHLAKNRKKKLSELLPFYWQRKK